MDPKLFINAIRIGQVGGAVVQIHRFVPRNRKQYGRDLMVVPEICDRQRWKYMVGLG